jgi:hypothetical protein
VTSGVRTIRERLMKRQFLLVSAALSLAVLWALWFAPPAQARGNASGSARNPAGVAWKFAASGDSRNCGDVVMPAIARGVKKSGALFYWHLGDFRKIISADEDIQHLPAYRSLPLSISEYQQIAWTDFINSQISPFGTLPVYLSIGNHEMVPPKTRAQFLTQFSHWLNAPNLHIQRLRDDPTDRKPKTYYHWSKAGVDFISLDNATRDQFDEKQLAWFEKALRSDSADRRIRTIVVSMHEALPDSIAENHSMNQSPTGIESGRRVYADLLRARDQGHKHVYVLASHPHYFLDGVFNTDYWRQHGGVLPGWIVGTAGAERYALPEKATSARAAKTNVYGFLLGTVSPGGEIRFTFQRVKESDIPAPVAQRYTSDFVHWCFAENSAAR